MQLKRCSGDPGISANSIKADGHCLKGHSLRNRTKRTTPNCFLTTSHARRDVQNAGSCAEHRNQNAAAFICMAQRESGGGGHWPAQEQQ